VRTPWPDGFPLVYVHCGWHGTAAVRLGDHPRYIAAKKKRDTTAARQVVHDLVSDDVADEVFDACRGYMGGPKPVVVAPSLSLDESQNVLAIGYGHWLAAEMGWELERRIFQSRTAGRDFVTDGWYRLVQQPAYYGAVQAERDYVVADDVCTMGGTMASLRGFIESKGGRVICMTALASGGGHHVEIALAGPTKSGLYGAHDGQLDQILRTELGYGLDCLTEPEGQFVLRCQTLDRFREGIEWSARRLRCTRSLMTCTRTTSPGVGASPEGNISPASAGLLIQRHHLLIGFLGFGPFLFLLRQRRKRFA
jgi:hypothetical protein